MIQISESNKPEVLNVSPISGCRRSQIGMHFRGLKNIK